MSHMVIFQTPEGNPGYNQFETIDESVGFVEKLRNEQNVQNARIFKLEEIKFDFQPYYRVRLQMLNKGDAPAAPAAPTATPAPAPAPAPAGGPAFGGPAGAPPPPAPPAPAPAPAGDVNSPVGATPGAPAPANGAAFTGAAGEEAPGRRGLFGR